MFRPTKGKLVLLILGASMVIVVAFCKSAPLEDPDDYEPHHR
jgi:hypothetical protein